MASPLHHKRKASFNDNDDEMQLHDGDESASRTVRRSSIINNGVVQKPKRIKTITASGGRNLPMERLLESQNEKGLRSIIMKLCESDPQVEALVADMVPRPTVTSAIDTLSQYINKIEESLPYKTDPMGDYAYIRVLPAINEYISALSDYTSHFLPPGEQQISTSLAFLDGASYTIHRLHDWNNQAHSFHKNLAYHEICQAWILCITQASKRAAGGISLAHGGWMEKLVKHNHLSNGKFDGVIESLQDHLSWMGGNNNNPTTNNSNSNNNFGMSPSPFPVFATFSS